MGQTHDEEKPELLTRQEAAKRLRISVTTLSRLYETGEIRAIRVGHAFRIPRVDIDRMVAGLPPIPRAGELAAEDVSTWPPTPSMLAADEDTPPALTAEDFAARLDGHDDGTAEQRRNDEDAYRHAQEVARHHAETGTPHPEDH